MATQINSARYPIFVLKIVYLCTIFMKIKYSPLYFTAFDPSGSGVKCGQRGGDAPLLNPPN